MNDGIDANLCSLKYATVENAASFITRTGPGALMAKLDLSNAYRHVLVHPIECQLLGVPWHGIYYCNRAVPFGLRSAPEIFIVVADGLAWDMFCRGICKFIHYLDDFFFCSPLDSTICQEVLRIAVPLCTELGLPTTPHKWEGPSTTISFLGIEIDSVKQELQLPQQKLGCLQATIKEWEARCSATKRQLQSLIGQLNHAAAVVKPGRKFLRQLIDTMKIPRKQSDFVRLNVQC